MMNDDTIVARSTPPGFSGISVIRISGPDAVSILKKIFRDSPREYESHRAYHGWIHDSKEWIDEVVVTAFRNPNSYTGEDVCEISCHGGTYVCQRIIDLVCGHGARPADAGEFTQRAFVNGKMDLAQAEAVMDLIHSQTEAARKLSTYQLEGALSRRINTMRNLLIKACSFLELELDFGEEDVAFNSREELLDVLDRTLEEAASFIASYQRGRLCRDGVRMVIVGRPNVGKSSILNCLLERERAIVTETPGTTRDTIEDILDVEGMLFIITDTAGISEIGDPIETEGVRRAEEAIKMADLILLVLDGSDKLSGEDEAVIQKALSTKKPTICTLNKSDLPGKVEENKVRVLLKDNPVIALSTKTGEGISELIAIMMKVSVSDSASLKGDTVICRARHLDCLVRAKESLAKAKHSLKSNLSQELIALDLRAAADALGEITGMITSEEILNQIFSEFCIGK